MKLRWAKKELKALNAIPQYNYIIEASFAGPNLRASTSSPEADQLYRDAVQLERKAGPLPFLKNADLLRLSLDRYNQLIRRYPTSDKIDDAAFRAGGIYEYFRDYAIAAQYYQRAYQWDPETIHPAKFRAAFVLDKRLHRRAEALELYQQALQEKNIPSNYKKFAEKRIAELTESERLEE
jgi:tetratricopeptide (TPR) repeat protein